MDAFDRVDAALNGRAVDRPPVLAHIGDHAGIIAGLSFDVMYHDAELAAQAHLDAQLRYGYDIVSIQVEPSCPVAEACGAKVVYHATKGPWIIDSPIKSDDDLEHLNVPDFMATAATRVMIEGTRILAERSPVPTAAYMTGPITFALQLMPYRDVMTRLINDPEFVHELVNKATEVIAAYAHALRDAGAEIFVICEHDLQMMSPAHAKTFSLRYLPRLLSIYKHNILHVCGQVTPHLEANADDLLSFQGLSTISIGAEVDVAVTQQLLDHQIGVAGNIDHIQLLPTQSPPDVEEAVHAAISAGEGDHRFMVSPGCEVTTDTPVDNVAALVDATISYRPDLHGIDDQI